MSERIFKPFVAFAAMFLLLPAAGRAEDAEPEFKLKQPIDTPFLEGPTSETRLKEFRAVRQSVQEKDEAGTDVENNVDLAYGAYQRGYFLTALDLALPRAESGDPVAQTLIGELYERGLGVARDRKQAATWYRFAAEAGNREAQFAYANMLIEGKVVPLDKEKANALLREAAKSGHVKANFNLAQIIIAGKPTHAGFKEALPNYEFAANGDLADAQYALSNIHATGMGVPFADLQKARYWLERAAMGGVDTAQVELGIWMANGKGGPRDEKAALSWFQRAAARDNAIAQNRLAKMYLYGIGTESDRVAAAAWNVIARRAGNRDAELDAMFQALSEIDKKRAIETANRWSKR